MGTSKITSRDMFYDALANVQVRDGKENCFQKKILIDYTVVITIT